MLDLYLIGIVKIVEILKKKFDNILIFVLFKIIWISDYDNMLFSWLKISNKLEGMCFIFNLSNSYVFFVFLFVFLSNVI